MIVTAYYDIYDKPARFWEYFDLFYDLAASGLPIVVFTDPAFVRKFRFLPSTVRVVPAPLDSFELYQTAMAYMGELPKERTVEKDTKAFFGLMATKAEFVKRAKELYPAVQTFLWCDFGISKIFKGGGATMTAVVEKLREILYRGRYHRMAIPGCWSEARFFSVDRVHWRFCGGFYVTPASFVDRFYDHVRAVLRDFTTNPVYKLSWETNIWYIISVCAEDRAMMQWYYSDHDQQMILSAPLEN